MSSSPTPVALAKLVEERARAGGDAGRHLAGILRANPELTAEQRRWVARVGLGLVVWRGRLDAICGSDAATRVATLLLEREGLTAAEAKRVAGVAPIESPLISGDPVIDHSFPRWLVERWSAQHGAAAIALLTSMNVPGPTSLRVNTRLTSRSAVLGELRQAGIRAQPSPVAGAGIRLDGAAELTSLDSWKQGHFEIQDEGSQAVIEAVHARPGELVVDLCAGAGGKALGLVDAMQGAGRLVAIDLDADRLRDLKGRVKRASAPCLDVRCGDANRPELTADLVAVCDAVLVDAPCSSSGVLRRSPNLRWTLGPSDFERFASLQRSLLLAAARLVRPGGRLVYATCSLDRTENEDVANGFAAAGFTRTGTRTLRPDVDGTDGFFIASWQRAGATEHPPQTSRDRGTRPS